MIRQLILISGLIFFIACKPHNVTAVKNYQPPIVSIDSLFKSHSVTRGKYHAFRITRAVDKFLDSMAMDSTLVYMPNYRLEKSAPSNYTISGVIAPAKLDPSDDRAKMVGALKGFITDNQTGITTESFGCFGKYPTDWGCFAYNPQKPDSTDYQDIFITFQLGLELRNLVPVHKRLEPVNVAGLKIFSFEESVRATNKEDRLVAEILTLLINNTFVFNQKAYKRKVIKNYTAYNYVSNYRLKKSERPKADFYAQVSLSRISGNNFRLEFNFTGENINLVAPSRLETFIEFDRDRIAKNDFSEIMLKLTPLLLSFTNMNVMFEN